jgi:hypothetical protein
MITKQSLEQKIVDLEKQREQLVANTNAVQGAILMTKQLIDELSAEEVVPEKKDQPHLVE